MEYASFILLVQSASGGVAKQSTDFYRPRHCCTEGQNIRSNYLRSVNMVLDLKYHHASLFNKKEVIAWRVKFRLWSSLSFITYNF